MKKDAIYPSIPETERFFDELLNSLRNSRINFSNKTLEINLPQYPGIDRFLNDLISIIQDLRRETATAISDNLIKEIDDADYILQDKNYNIFKFASLTADKDFILPSYVGYEGYEFDIINLSDYTIAITPDGTENINDWNSTFEITEKGGRVRILALSDRWLLAPLNDACIYEVSSETADTGLALDGTWDDVSGMTLLNGVYGKGDLYAFANQLVGDTGTATSLQSYWGLGKTSGNNSPDIKDDYISDLRTNSSDLRYFGIGKHIHKFFYESDGSTIYMKAAVNTGNTSHVCYGATDCPMYIKFVRRY